MGCACSKSLYEYSMDSSTEDLIKSYEQTQRDSGMIVEKTNMYFYHRHQKVVANLFGKLWVVISDAVDRLSFIVLMSYLSIITHIMALCLKPAPN